MATNTQLTKLYNLLITFEQDFNMLHEVEQNYKISTDASKIVLNKENKRISLNKIGDFWYLTKPNHNTILVDKKNISKNLFSID